MRTVTAWHLVSAGAMTAEEHLTARRVELRDQKAQLIAYLLSKIKAEDFHAVQDAASDIREIDAKLDELPR